MHTGHRHVPRSQFSCKYDSKSKHCKKQEINICYPVHHFKILLPSRHSPLFVCLFIPAALTWTCLQSWPLAGSCIRRKVIGHLRETLMAVCSTPSSPLSVAFPDDAATLLKFLLTLMQREDSEDCDSENDQGTRLQNVTVFFCLYLWWCSALQAEASSSVSPGARSVLRACGPAAAQTSATIGGKTITVTDILIRLVLNSFFTVSTCLSWGKKTSLVKF